MHIVPKPEWMPHECAVTLQSEDPRGFVDTGMNLPYVDPRVYVSAQAVEDMGRLFGFPTQAEHAELEAELEQLKADNLQLLQELEGAERLADAAYTSLERAVRDHPEPSPEATERVAA